MPFFSKANETKLRRNLQVCSVTVKHTPYVLVTLASMQPASFCLRVSWLDNCIAYLWGCDPALPSASLVFTDTHTPAVISYWTDSLSPQERVQTQSAVEICSPDASQTAAQRTGHARCCPLLKASQYLTLWRTVIHLFITL